MKKTKGGIEKKAPKRHLGHALRDYTQSEVASKAANDLRVQSARASSATKFLKKLYELKDNTFERGEYDEGGIQVLKAAIAELGKPLYGFSKVELAARLGVSTSIVENVKQGGRTKLENFLKLLGGAIKLCENLSDQYPVSAPVFSGHSAQWTAVRSEAAKKIARLSIDISDLLNLLRTSNSLALDHDIITPELKAQLVAILESVLYQLKSPIVEKGFLGKAGKWILGIAKKTAASKAESGLSELSNQVGEGIIDTLSDLVP